MLGNFRDSPPSKGNACLDRDPGVISASAHCRQGGGDSQGRCLVELIHRACCRKQSNALPRFDFPNCLFTHSANID